MIDTNSEYVTLCAEQLIKRVRFYQGNSEELIMRILHSATSESFAKRNPGFKLRKTARSRATFWCCYAGPNVPIYDFLNGTVHLTTPTDCFVLSGTRGERHLISLVNLSRAFSFGGSDYITPANIRKIPDGKWFKVYPLVIDNTDLDISNTPVWAISIPEELEFSVTVNPNDVRAGNIHGVDHAAGDLLLVGDIDGRPDFTKLGIVNGGVFADCFSKLNFPNYLPYMHAWAVKEPVQLLIDRY